jgi:acetoin utilization protein AcuB
MFAKELISDRVPSVKSTDTAGLALDWMGEFKLHQLPIVDEGVYKGMITENDILDTTDLSDRLSDIKYSGWDSAYIYEGQHPYDAIEIMSNLKLEVLPILDEEDQYMGVVTLRDLMNFLGNLLALHEPGGIVVLRIPGNGYVLSEIGRITESADAKVLSLYLSNDASINEYLLTIKLNVQDLSRVVAAFERYKYEVVRTYHRGQQLDDYQQNLDALLRYLDI